MHTYIIMSHKNWAENPQKYECSEREHYQVFHSCWKTCYFLHAYQLDNAHLHDKKSQKLGEKPQKVCVLQMGRKTSITQNENENNQVIHSYRKTYFIL